MKKINKKIIVSIFIILMSLFIGAKNTNAINSTYDARASFAGGRVVNQGYTNNGKVVYKVASRGYMANYYNIYCIEHHQNIADANIMLNYTGTYEYTSDSDSQFVRAAAYILKYGLDNGIGGYSPMNSGANGGACQQALWHLEWNFIRGANNGLVPFAGRNSGDAIEPWIPNGAEGAGLMGTEALYNAATQVGIIPYTSPINNSTISIDMSTEGNCSTCSLEGFYGEGLQQITEIKIKYKNDTKLYDFNSGKFRIYSNEDFSDRIENLSQITEPNATFYLQNLDTNRQIESIEIKGTSRASGYKILIHHFENQASASQDLIVPEKVEPQNAEFSGTAKNKVQDSRLQIIKRDKKTKKGISDLYIKIYCVGTGEDRQQGWITKSDGSGDLTYNENAAYKFKTDENGKINLENINRLGEYHIYEFRSSSNYNKLTENEKIYDINMQREYYKDIVRDPNGVENASLVYLGMANVNKRNKLFRVIKYQVKNPTLEIIKQDNRSQVGISDLFIKIYCIRNDGERGWIGTSDGSGDLENDANKAYKFKTDENGKVRLDKLAKLGRYFIYECKSNSDYNKLTENEKIYTIEAQKEYYKDKEEDSIWDENYLNDNKLVYLGEVNVNETNKLFKVFKNQIRTRKLTIRKMDYDTNTLINGVGFKIFYKELKENPSYGWLGYESGKIVYGKSFDEAFIFKTGQKYNGDIEEGKSYTGEINLNNLNVGKYNIFEVTSNGEYSIKDQPGYKYTNNSEWNIPKNAEYALIGPGAYDRGYAQVDFVDGYSYDFYRDENVENVTERNRENYIYLSEYPSSTTVNGRRYYSTSHALVTVRNKKHTELVIEKTYKDSSGNINKLSGAGIKVLVKLKEDIGGSTFKKDTYAWLKDEKGNLTKNIKEAKEFVTGSDGQEKGTYKINNVPYGTYTCYEVTPPEGFSLEQQDGYNAKLPTDGYDKTENGKWSDLSNPNHAKIGDEITIQAKTVSNYGNNENEAVLLSGQYSFKFEESDKTNKFLGIENNGIRNGQQVKFYSTADFDGGISRNACRFNLSYAGHGYYRIKHKGTEMFLGLERKQNTEKAGQYSLDINDKTQLWSFKFVSNTDKVRIANKVLNNDGEEVYIGRDSDNNGKSKHSGGLRFIINAPEKNIEAGTEDHRTDTADITNRKNSLQIYKIDKTYKQDLGRENDIYLSAKLAIYARNTGKWISIDDEGNPSETTKVSYIEITENHTAENPLKIFNLSEGNYDIYEAETPNGYNKTKQDGYMNNNNQDPNAFSLKNKWVYLKSVNIRNNGETVTAPLENIKPSNLTGKVWADKEEPEKGAQRDNLYGSDTNDELLNGITVNLISHKDGENTKIASTTTKNINNINGTYLFERKDNGDYITYWELAYCHVEFIYDNKNYVVATPFAGDSTEQKANNSKALPNNIITEGGATLNDERTNKGELYDGNLVGAIDAEFGGKARTYIGETSGLRATLIKNNKEQEPNKQQNKLLTAFYNENNYTVENINLGLIEQLKSPMGIEEKLAAVKIIRKDENGGQYEFTYEDDKPFALADSGINQDIVKTENRTYYPYLYPTDIKYNFASDISDEYKNKVYLVYRIRVKNNNTLDYEDIYEEQYFKLTKLTNKFDNTLYEINNEDIGYEKNAAWNITGEGTAEAIVDITLRPQEAWDTYIQFRVKNDSLPDINKDNQNITTATGYHKYTRADRNWEDGNNSNWDWSKVPHREHFTENEEDTSSAIGIEWQHRDARTISGNVFEDHKNESRLNERIGNGKKDDGENGVEGVVVTLIDAQTEDAQTDRIAKLYDGSLEEGENGKWQSSSSDAVFTVGADGKYELKGVIPGNYYLQFSYGNGNVTYKDLNGNDITKDIETKIDNKSIDSNLYKSTILTGNVSDTSKNERNWFLNNEEHSIALDSEETINKRIDKDGENIKEELNYSTIRSQEVINAKSPEMNVQFEYIYFDSEEKTPKIAYSLEDKNKVYDNNLESDCTGMNFGIIERPKVDIQLDKNIENVKFTLQNNTTIINGNPNDQNVSSSLSSWADKEDEFNSTAKIELDSSLLYGSDISVTYVMVAHNESELDYATENYYKYGIIEDPEDIVKTAVTRIAEYIDNGNAKHQILSNNITVENLDESIYLTEKAKTVNKNFDKKALVANEEGKLLTPSVKAKDGSDRETYKITVSNLLSNSDTLYGWENYSEIVGIRNKTKTPQSTSHFGSLEIKNPETDEPDDANATIILTSPTGENRDLTIYYIIVGVFILLAIGATFILKKNKHK